MHCIGNASTTLRDSGTPIPRDLSVLNNSCAIAARIVHNFIDNNLEISLTARTNECLQLCQHVVPVSVMHLRTLVVNLTTAFIDTIMLRHRRPLLGCVLHRMMTTTGVVFTSIEHR